jgi:hypothetical protein
MSYLATVKISPRSYVNVRLNNSFEGRGLLLAIYRFIHSYYSINELPIHVCAGLL